MVAPGSAHATQRFQRERFDISREQAILLDHIFLENPAHRSGPPRGTSAVGMCILLGAEALKVSEKLESMPKLNNAICPGGGDGSEISHSVLYWADIYHSIHTAC